MSPFSQYNAINLNFTDTPLALSHCVGVHLFALWPEYQINDNNILFVIILWLDLGIKSLELNALHIPTRNSQKRTVVNIIIVQSPSSDVNWKVNIKNDYVVLPGTTYTSQTVLPYALIVYQQSILISLNIKYTIYIGSK